jgi:hypothetical protein
MTNAAAFALGALTGPDSSFDRIEWQLAHREKEIYGVLTACRRSLSFLTERAAEAR